MGAMNSLSDFSSPMNLALFQINEELNRGNQLFDKCSNVGRFLCLTSLVVGVALAIFFPPYAALAVLPLGCYGVYTWTRGMIIKNWCISNQRLAQDLQNCYNNIFSLGLLPESVKEIKEKIELAQKDRVEVERQAQQGSEVQDIKTKIETTLKEIDRIQEAIKKNLKAYDVSHLSSYKPFKAALQTCTENRNRCQIACKDMFESNSNGKETRYKGLPLYLEYLNDLKAAMEKVGELNRSLCNEFFDQHTFKVLYKVL